MQLPLPQMPAVALGQQEQVQTHKPLYHVVPSCFISRLSLHPELQVLLSRRALLRAVISKSCSCELKLFQDFPVRSPPGGWPSLRVNGCRFVGPLPQLHCPILGGHRSGSLCCCGSSPVHLFPWCVTCSWTLNRSLNEPEKPACSLLHSIYWTVQKCPSLL